MHRTQPHVFIGRPHYESSAETLPSPCVAHRMSSVKLPLLHLRFPRVDCLCIIFWPRSFHCWQPSIESIRSSVFLSSFPCHRPALLVGGLNLSIRSHDWKSIYRIILPHFAGSATMAPHPQVQIYKETSTPLQMSHTSPVPYKTPENAQLHNHNTSSGIHLKYTICTGIPRSGRKRTYHTTKNIP